MTIRGLIPPPSRPAGRGRWRRVILVTTVLAALACSESTDPFPTTYTIELSPTSVNLELPPGDPRSVVVTATVRDNAGAVVSPAAVLWTTDSLGVATVSQAGIVTAVGEGMTLLRAR